LNIELVRDEPAKKLEIFHIRSIIHLAETIIEF